MIETERLILRKMTVEDFDAVAEMLRDERVMYAWEKTFSDEEITAWIQRRIAGYEKNGTDYFLALEKTQGRPVGQIGLLQEEIEGKSVYGLGWILNYKDRGQGYAAEGARGLVRYAFDTLGLSELVADIRPQNMASRKVAESLNMQVEGSFIKHWDGKEMEHLLYVLRR